MVELLIDPNRPMVTDPLVDIGAWVGSSNRSVVSASRFHKDDGTGSLTEEWLAVKLVECDTQSQFDHASQEFSLLRDLEHNHIIAVVGAYKETDVDGAGRLGILLFPLAPCNLTQYLARLSKSNAERSWSQKKHSMRQPSARALLSFFPCLCRAVLYLHAKRIKHRDIKPGNILIDDAGTVILTDLDIAKRYRSIAEARTYGKTKCTIRYAPKDVLDGKRHGFSWDVNSLGFVFLEMASIIFGETNDNMLNCLIGRDKCTHCEKWAHAYPACPLARPRSSHHKSASGTDNQLDDACQEEAELRYSEALEKGRIKEWFTHLHKISQDKPGQLPLSSPSGMGPDDVDRFLGMIMRLMKAEESTQLKTLKDAWQLFSGFSPSDCVHCHPKVSHMVTLRLYFS